MAVYVCDVHLDHDQKEIAPLSASSFPAVCYEDDMSKISVPTHWHNEYEYNVCVRGTSEIFVNTEKIILHKNEAVFINSGALHSASSVEKNESIIHSIVISPTLIGGSSDSVIFQKLIVPLSLKEAPSYILLDGKESWHAEVCNAMHPAWKCITEETYDYENEARYRISRAIRILVDHLPDVKENAKSDAALLGRMKSCLSYIEQHYAEDISSDDLTRLCGCSESVLLRAFRQTVSSSPQQYIIKYRIRKASEMLLTTDLKSRDIALSCGFNDFSYFTKTFRKIMGITPSLYRENIRVK